jgi:D-alanine-D-alanine ligase
VAVLFGGPSPEHDVSILTGLLVCHELLSTRNKNAVTAIYWTKNGSFFEVDPALEASAFIEGTPSAGVALMLAVGPEGGFSRRKGRLGGAREPVVTDAVVLCCHGGPGEDGTMQGALDLSGVAYTGPSAMGAALGMDKLASAAILSSAGISVLDRRLLSSDSAEPDYDGPYIIKPRFGGSSIGIEVVRDLQTARLRAGASVHLRRGAVLEPYREDLYDLQVAIRTWPVLELSAIERPVRQRQGAEILDYADKYVGGEGMHAAARELPATLSSSLEARLRSDTIRAAELLQVRGVARVDFLSDGEELFLNEVNTIPGSLSRHLFVNPYRNFSELLRDLLEEAVQSPAARFSSAGADGVVLRSAHSIASKLG